MSKSKQSKSSRRWLKAHHEDPYVKKARQEGLRSRSVYKLKEIQEKDDLIKPGHTVIDIGAAPGGWSECAANCAKENGRVIALDILPIAPFSTTHRNRATIESLQGDFNQPETVNRLLSLVEGRPVDVVLSDIAPNTSGIRDVDQLKTIQLVEEVLAFAIKVLQPKGCLLVKVFHGIGFDDYLNQLRQHFQRVVVRKPKASRSRSREVYLLASQLKPEEDRHDE